MMNLFRVLAVCAALGAVATAQAQQDWLEGVHYDVVEDVGYTPPEDGSIEVVELFWYGCGSCYQFEPEIERWLETKPDDVRFIRVAASMAPAWRTHARAFYTAEALDVVDQVHGRIFRALHVERNPLNDADAIARLFARHAGVDAETFRRAWDSFGVETRMRRGDQFARRYQLTGVPAVVVAGKYRTNPSRAQGYDALIALIDHLVERERGGPAEAGERAPRAQTPAEPAPAADSAREAVTDERGAVLWWLWLGVLLVVVVIVVVAMRGRGGR